MRIYQPENDDEGLSTSFTFDDKTEQQSFVSWLNSLGIGYLRSRIPVINEGVLSQQECLIINVPEEEVEVEEEIIEEKTVLVENKSDNETKQKKKKKKNDNE